MPWKTDKIPPSYIGKEDKEILKTRALKNLLNSFMSKNNAHM